MIRLVYILGAIAGFVVATTGSDILTRISIGGSVLRDAWGEYIHYTFKDPFGMMLDFFPFISVAMICMVALKRAKGRIIHTIFFIGIISMVYFYYRGYQSYQEALLDEKWTAAALSIGLLPFFVGLPIVLIVGILAALVAKIDRRNADNIEAYSDDC